MQNAGWCIGSHGMQNDAFNNLGEMTLEEQLDELAQVKSWMESNGFPDWWHYSFPQGERNQNSLAALRQLGFRTARVLNTPASAGFVLAPGYSLLQLRAMNTNESTTGTGTYDSSILTDQVDEAITEGQILIFYTHGLLSPTLANGHTDPQAFQDLLDHVDAAGASVQVKTIPELYAEATAV